MSIPIKISGSRSAAVLGLSQYSTPVSVWLEIMGREFCEKNNYEFPIFEGNAATIWGTAFEGAIIELTEQKTDKKITDREKFFEKDYLTCHVDGIIDDCLYEAKTTSVMTFRDSWGEPGTDKIPIDYMLQVQHNMLLSGLDKCILSVLVFPRRVEEWEEMGWEIYDNSDNFQDDYSISNFKDGNDSICFPIAWARVLDQMGYFHQYEIRANPELHALMLQKYSTFWTDHVLTGTPPVPMSVDDIKALVREPVGTIIADDRVERLVMERDNIMSEIGKGGSLSKRAEDLRLEILKYMTESGAVLDDESRNKFILRGRDGKKLASYGKDKNGRLIFR